MASPLIQAGRWLFRFRSVTPVPVLVGLFFLLWRSRADLGPFGPGGDLALDALGLLCACAGEAVRLYVTGWVPEGTSGQNDRLEASVLNTRGPYAHVRNPLYVGNFFICLGLSLIAADGWAALLGLGFFAFEYFFIVRAEEDFLRGRFQATFDAYCAQVPRWLPRLSAASEGKLREGRFDWRRALKKEHNPMAAWLLGAIALLTWEHVARGGALGPALLIAFTAGGLVVAGFLAVKGWKHGWLKRAT